MQYSKPETDADCEMMLAPEILGKGNTREVFPSKLDSSVVLKRAINLPHTNMIEWILWNSVVGTLLEPIFARCFSISESGRYLIMERLAKLKPCHYHLVPDVPEWLTDRKIDAFGLAKDETVKVSDYGLLNLNGALNSHLTPVAFAINAKVMHKLRRK